MTTESDQPAESLPADLAALRDAAAASAAAEQNASATQGAPGAGKAEPGADPAAQIEAAAALLEGAELPAETVEDWVNALDMALAWFLPAYPGLEAVYTAEAKGRLAKVFHALAKKYNWTIAGLFLRWKEEIMLVFIAGPILRDTSKVLKAGRVVATQAKAPAPQRNAAPSAEGVLRPNE